MPRDRRPDAPRPEPVCPEEKAQFAWQTRRYAAAMQRAANCKTGLRLRVPINEARNMHAYNMANC
jgi:hypothetical protein